MKLLISKGRNRYRFYALFLLLLLSLFLDYTLQISIPSLVYIVLLICAALLGDQDEIISVCICCIPLCTAIEWHYIVIFCIAVLLFKYGRHIKLDSGVLPLFLIVIWEVMHCFSGGANLKMIIAYLFLYLFFVVMFFLSDMRTIDYGFIVRNFAIAVFWVCCVLVLRLLIHNKFNFDIAFLDMQRLGLADEEIGGMIINPNALGVQCVLAVGGLMQMRSSGQKRVFDALLMISILVLGALTCSRTYVACLFILVVFLFIVSDIGAKERFKLLLGSLAALLISVVLLYLVFPVALETFIQRWTAEDLTSGRNALFVAYNDYLFSSVKACLWGLGSLNLDSKVMQLSIANNVPHNGIQEILVAWGIIGLVLFVAMILVLMRRSKQENPHQTWGNYSLFIVLISKIMVGQVITSDYTMLSFALIYLSLCQDCSNEKDYK